MRRGRVGLRGVRICILWVNWFLFSCCACHFLQSLLFFFLELNPRLFLTLPILHSIKHIAIISLSILPKISHSNQPLILSLTSTQMHHSFLHNILHFFHIFHIVMISHNFPIFILHLFCLLMLIQDGNNIILIFHFHPKSCHYCYYHDED